MAKTVVHAAAMVQLSPSSTATIYGPGRVILERGGRTFSLNEREARILVEQHVLYEEARRPSAAQE